MPFSHLVRVPYNISKGTQKGHRVSFAGGTLLALQAGTEELMLGDLTHTRIHDFQEEALAPV